LDQTRLLSTTSSDLPWCFAYLWQFLFWAWPQPARDHQGF
jgi:hypothetical protein